MERSEIAEETDLQERAALGSMNTNCQSETRCYEKPEQQDRASHGDETERTEQPCTLEKPALPERSDVAE